MKTKICSNPKCLKEKPLSAFSKDKNRKDGLNVYCNDCCKIFSKNYRTNNKEKIKNKAIDHKKQFPWKATLKYIKNRCEHDAVNGYEYYGGRGIECKITAEELEFLWNRDKAWLLKKPSIDRIDSNKHYTLGNCQYIELVNNSTKRNKENNIRSVIQYTTNNIFIKEWRTIQDASNMLIIDASSISKCAKHKRLSAGGYKWEYKIDK